jgi:hypothetical protein
MARDTKQRSTRRDPSLAEGSRPVQLRESRRFFSPRGDQSAVRKANALQQALGLGVDLYAGHLEKKNEQGAALAATQASQGLDRDQTNTNKGYVETYEKVEAGNDLATFAQELPKLLESEGWTDLTEEDAIASVNQYYEGQLRGVDPESVYGKTVAEGVLKQTALLLDGYRTVKGEEARAENREMIYNKTEAAYKASGTIDHPTLMKELNEMVPGPGGRQTYLDTVFQLAEAAGDPTIVASIPDTFPNGEPTGVNDPNLKPMFDDALTAAAGVQTERQKAFVAAEKAATQTERAAMHALDKQMAAAGDPKVLQSISEGGRPGPNGEAPRYSEEQQTALYTSLFKAQAKGGSDSALAQDFGNGALIGGTQDEYDRGHDSYIQAADAQLMMSNPEISPEQRKEMLRQYSVERSVVNGRLPSVLKDQLSVNIRNPARFKQAGELYRQLEAQLPGFVETQLSDKQSRMLETYTRLLQDTGSEQAALEALEAFEPLRWKSDAIDQEDLQDSIEDAIVDVTDERIGPFDYAETDRLRARVSAEVKHYVDMGYDVDQAAEFASTAIKKRSVRAGDYLYNLDAGWGTDAQAEMEWAVQNEADHQGVEADSIRLVPHPSKPNFVLIENIDSILPGTGFEMRISEIAANYKRYQSDVIMDTLEGGALADDELVEKAKQRAFEKMFPPEDNIWGKPGDRVARRKAQEKAWKELPMTERNRLIRQEFVQ